MACLLFVFSDVSKAEAWLALSVTKMLTMAKAWLAILRVHPYIYYFRVLYSYYPRTFILGSSHCLRTLGLSGALPAVGSHVMPAQSPAWNISIMYTIIIVKLC